MILGEVVLRNIPNDYIYKKKYLDVYSNEIETLVLGSSHSFYGVNPAFFFKNTFNASHISQSFDYDLEILEKYDGYLGELKTVVIPISYFSLFHKLESGSESWRIKNYIIYYLFMITSFAIFFIILSFLTGSVSITSIIILFIFVDFIDSLL